MRRELRYGHDGRGQCDLPLPDAATSADEAQSRRRVIKVAAPSPGLPEMRSGSIVACLALGTCSGPLG